MARQSVYPLHAAIVGAGAILLTDRCRCCVKRWRRRHVLIHGRKRRKTLRTWCDALHDRSWCCVPNWRSRDIPNTACAQDLTTGQKQRSTLQARCTHPRAQEQRESLRECTPRREQAGAGATDVSAARNSSQKAVTPQRPWLPNVRI